MFPDDSSIRSSHEIIYTALYAMPRGEDRRGEIPNMVSIHQRLLEVDERVIPDTGRVSSLKVVAMLRLSACLL